MLKINLKKYIYYFNIFINKKIIFTTITNTCLDPPALSDQLRNKNRPKIQEINLTDSPHMVP